MNEGDKQSKGLTVALIAVALIAIFTMLCVYIVGYNQAEAYVRFGPWGDFVAGVLNPILTFFTFIGVLYTISLQATELGLSRQELSRSAEALEKQSDGLDAQRFDAAFFGLVSTYENILSSIDLRNTSSGFVTSGRDCFNTFYTKLSRTYKKHQAKNSSWSDEYTLEFSYKSFWRDQQLELGHYFRFLFNFMRFVDESPHCQSHHRKILRSLLSNQELLIIFYNCISDEGRNFTIYAKRFELFDNLPTERLLKFEHTKFLPSEVYGSNPMKSPKDMRPAKP
ncbi:putative phage abortive infection protein [Rhodobacteraceae bacterium M385]|nr:putative phage abortive infection protein [Rhodobacteraceae bacterium M385]